MLLTTEHNEVQMKDVGAVARATIKATPKVFSFFSNQTYTNKHAAIVRELTANAIDSHTMAGNPDPVTVTLPTVDDPTLRVKDQGVGMSHEFMMTNALAYTDGSTKNNSNSQIGGFGIGMKSPFSFTDQFMIRSVHEGQVGTYSLFKDEEDIPSIACLSLEPTDEPNGVEVIVPVEPKDFDKFIEVAKTTLAYFDPMPKLIGAQLSPPDYLVSGNGWAVRPQPGPLAVIMGGVRYPVESHHLPYDMRSMDLINYGIDLTLPIGSCGVALSREALSFDDTTLATLRSAVESIQDDIIASFATMFDGCQSLWEAKVQLHNETKSFGYRSAMVRRHAKYKGEDLDLNQYARCSVALINRRSRANTRIRSIDYRYGITFQPGLIHRIIVEDDCPRATARIRHAYEQEFLDGKVLLVVRDSENWRESLGFPPQSMVVRASSLPLPPPEARTRTRAGVKLYKNVSTEISEIGDRTVKVVMKAFTLPRFVSLHNSDGLINDNEVVYVNQKDADAVEHLTDYAEEWNRRAADYRANHAANAGYALALEEKLSRYFWVVREMGDLELTPAQLKRPFGKMVTLYNKYIKDRPPIVSSLVEKRLPPRVNADELIAQLHSEQWQVVHVLDLARWNLYNRDDTKRLLKCLI